MKIAIVIEQFKPGGGGNERSTEQIAERLIARGHEVVLLTNTASDDAEQRVGFPIRVAGGPKTSSAWGLWRFRRWAERQLDAFDASLSVTLAVPATIVQPRGGTYRETLRANIGRRGGPMGRRLRQFSTLISPKQLAMLREERRTLNHPRVRKVVAISFFVADQLFEHYTVPSRRIELIPNAASIEPMNDQQRRTTRHKLRDAFGFTEDDVVGLFAAMNPALKGLPQLIRAVAGLEGEGKRTRLLVAGECRISDIQLADARGVGDRIRWVGRTARIDALYAAADFTVLPTFYDPASKVVIESLLHGVPAISTRHNGASQWIADPAGGAVNTSPLGHRVDDAAPTDPPRPAGRVIDRPDRIDQLIAALTALCDDDERRRCAEAAKVLDPRLNMDVHVEALERLITSPNGDGPPDR